MERLAKTSGHLTRTAFKVNHTAKEAATEMAGERLLFTGCYTDSTPFLFGTAGEGILAFSVRPAPTLLSIQFASCRLAFAC
eukprot:SAG11_NODE_5791_length_1463_cov_3.444282_3_plen_81_part_00